MIDMLHDHMNRGIGAQLNLSTKITQKTQRVWWF